MTPSTVDQQIEDFVRDLDNEMSYRRAEKFRQRSDEKYHVKKPKKGRFRKWIKSITSW